MTALQKLELLAGASLAAPFGPDEARDVIVHINQLIAALEFYADPATYHAIGFFPDRPCGDFIDDFSDTEELGRKPGKLARKTLDW